MEAKTGIQAGILVSKLAQAGSPAAAHLTSTVTPLGKGIQHGLATPIMLDQVRMIDGIAYLGSMPLGESATVIGWNVRPHQMAHLRQLESQGVRVLNKPEAISATAQKGTMTEVLKRAGLPHVEGSTVRLKAHLEEAASKHGFPFRVTGGYSFSQAVPHRGEGWMGWSGSIRPQTIRNQNQLEIFAAKNLDGKRLFLVQPHVEGPKFQITVAGNTILDSGRGSVEMGGVTEQEKALALATVQSFGLDAGSAVLARTPDGPLVLDVHSTPRLLKTRLEALRTSPKLTAALDGAPAREPWMPQAVMAERTGIGVLNMGTRPGKNISRVMAEIERRGARAEFISMPNLEVHANGSLTHFGKPAPKVETFLTRTGAVIDDESLLKLKWLEDTGHDVVNNAKAVSPVRNKNTAGRVLARAGIPHPKTMEVAGVRDAEKAIGLIGSPMVLKNPASSEGRGVMFLGTDDAVRGIAELFEHKTEGSALVATSAHGGSKKIPVATREDAERAIHELGNTVLDTDPATGWNILRIQSPITLTDTATGKSTTVDRAVSVLSIRDAFTDAKPGAVLKAEPWYMEAAGVDKRVHVMFDEATGKHRVIAKMQRKAAPNVYGEARSNLSLNGKASDIDLTPEEEQVAIAAAKRFGLKIAGVDLLATKNGPVVLEVNISPGLDIEHTVGPVADQWVDMIFKRVEKLQRGTTKGTR